MDIVTVTLTAVSMMLFIAVPGFMLSLALFPSRKEIDVMERAGVTFVLGLMPQFLLYFADKNMYIPINSITSYMTVLLVSLAGLGIWFYRKG
ncbi:MAG: hypothetical protein U9M95_05625 [Candidatus Altiarchaeota archaeon]|nr:hypothetical protein [Candidatus Altiarchaeota archaeon]